MPVSDIEKLTLWDDIFARIFLRDNLEVVEDLVNGVLEGQNIKIVDVQTQYEIPHLQSKSVIFDGLATDSDGNVYGLEIQNRPEDGFEKRLLYNGGLLIRLTLKKGEKPSQARKSYVIALAKFPPKNASENRSSYEFAMMDIKSHELLDEDGLRILWINDQCRPSTDTLLGKVLHDASSATSSEMLLDSFRESMKIFKETEEGVRIMGEIEAMIRKSEAKNNTIGLIRDLLGYDFPEEHIREMVRKRYEEEEADEIIAIAKKEA